MLNAVMLSVVMLNDVMLKSVMPSVLNAECSDAECHYAEGHAASISSKAETVRRNFNEEEKSLYHSFLLFVFPTLRVTSLS